MADILHFRNALKPNVIVSRWVPDGEIYFLGDGCERPSGWDELTTTERIEWMVEHHQAIVIKGLET